MDGSLPSFQSPLIDARPTHEIADQIIELAGHLNAGNYRFLTLIAEFDRRSGWACGATQDCAHWLNWKCGINLGAAREKVRTARALEKLPQVSAAMERGEVSYSKVRAITRVATPENEHYFLQIALHGTAHHVETLVRAYRRSTEAEELSREHQQQLNRFVRYEWDNDGSLVMKARLPAEVGALVLKALDLAMPETSSPEVPDPRTRSDGFIPPDTVDRPSLSHKRADALGVIFESFLANGVEAMTGGERHQIVVHVSAETLKAGGGCCEIEDGPAIAAETARRLSCDASLVAIVENEKGEPLSVGRKMSNLVTLCRFHHRKVHEGEVIVQVLDDGAIRFVQPDGECFDSVSLNHTHPLGNWRLLLAIHERAGIHIDAKTAATRWDGGPMDYGMAMDSLMRLRRDVSAETV